MGFELFEVELVVLILVFSQLQGMMRICESVGAEWWSLIRRMAGGWTFVEPGLCAHLCDHRCRVLGSEVVKERLRCCAEAGSLVAPAIQHKRRMVRRCERLVIKWNSQKQEFNRKSDAAEATDLVACAIIARQNTYNRWFDLFYHILRLRVGLESFLGNFHHLDWVIVIDLDLILFHDFIFDFGFC